jgi:hypothetical protein
MVRLAGTVALLLAVPGAASAASPLRPPSLNERTTILRWADRHPGVAGSSSAVNRICVHRARPRQAAVHFAHVSRGRTTVLLRRHAPGWRRSRGGQVRGDLLRRSCTLRPTPTAPPVNAASRLTVDRFGPLELGMTFGGAQWATRTRLDRHDLFNPPCHTFGTRGLNTAFFGLTTNGVVRRLVITGAPLATAEGLRIGDTEAQAIAIYGAPDRRQPAPFIPGGEDLIYRTTVDAGPPRRRVVMTDQDDLVVEVSVGFRPEVDFDEGCA